MSGKSTKNHLVTIWHRLNEAKSECHTIQLDPEEAIWDLQNTRLMTHNAHMRTKRMLHVALLFFERCYFGISLINLASCLVLYLAVANDIFDRAATVSTQGTPR